MRLALAALVVLTSASGFAADRDADGWIHTGEGIRTKKVAFINVKVYAIDHAMKELPAEKSKQGVISAEVDKKIAWKMLRTVEAEKIRKALRDGYAKNGFSDAGKIDKLVTALDGDLKEGAWVTILYDAKTQKTTLYAPGGASAQVTGTDFMRATWSLWFGNIDQPALSESLLSKLH